jgi:hypothetical protein
MIPGYGCAICKLPAFGHNAGNIADHRPDRQTGAYANPITTGIDFFIIRNYAINLKLNLCGQDTDINAPETAMQFDAGTIGPLVHCKYYF